MFVINIVEALPAKNVAVLVAAKNAGLWSGYHPNFMGVGITDPNFVENVQARVSKELGVAVKEAASAARNSANMAESLMVETAAAEVTSLEVRLSGLEKAVPAAEAQSQTAGRRARGRVRAAKETLEQAQLRLMRAQAREREVHKVHERLEGRVVALQTLKYVLLVGDDRLADQLRELTALKADMAAEKCESRRFALRGVLAGLRFEVFGPAARYFYNQLAHHRAALTYKVDFLRALGHK